MLLDTLLVSDEEEVVEVGTDALELYDVEVELHELKNKQCK